MSLMAAWEALEWPRRTDYAMCRRIIIGETRTVRLDVDVLRKAYTESESLRNALPIGMSRALEILNEREGRPVTQRGSGNTLPVNSKKE